MKLKKLDMGGVQKAAIDTVGLGVGAMSSGAIENVANNFMPASAQPYTKYGIAAGFIALSASISGKDEMTRFVRNISTGVALKQVYDIVTGQLKKVLPVNEGSSSVMDKAVNGFVGLNGASNGWDLPTQGALAAAYDEYDNVDSFNASTSKTTSLLA